MSAGAFVASFVGTLLMFALPVTALGAVSPWAIRLAVTDIAEAGAVAGRLYALSTLGSIAGTFLPVLYLIPQIGTRRTLLLSRGSRWRWWRCRCCPGGRPRCRRCWPRCS